MKRIPQYIEVTAWIWFEGVDHDDALGCATPGRRFELDLASVVNFFEEEHPNEEAQGATTIETTAGGYYTIDIPFDEFKRLIRAFRGSFAVWITKMN